MNTTHRIITSIHWLGLALAFALATQSVVAQGTIVCVHLSTPNPDPNSPWDFQGMRLLAALPQSYNLDFNADGTPEYIIRASGPFSTAGFGIYAQGQHSVWAHRPFDSLFPAALPGWLEIGPALTSPTYGWFENQNGLGATFSNCVDIGCLGYYTGLDSAYCALRFNLAGQAHYGWVRVGSPLAGNGGWIYDYAYDTRPDAAIFTGIPEPSTWALALCGLALLLFRQRR